MHGGTERTSYIPFPLNPETRSDATPVRPHFRETLPQARQPISHRKICVNNGMVNITRSKVSHGDPISIKENYARTGEVMKYPHIEISVNEIVIKFLDHPERMWRRTETKWLRLPKNRKGCRLPPKSWFSQQLRSSIQEKDLEREKISRSERVCSGSFFAEHKKMKRNLHYSEFLLLLKRRNGKNRNIPTRTMSLIVNNGNLCSNSTYCSESPYCDTRKRRIKGIEPPTHYSEVNHRTLKAVVSYGPDMGHIPHDIRLKDPNLPLWSRNGRRLTFVKRRKWSRGKRVGLFRGSHHIDIGGAREKACSGNESELGGTSLENSPRPGMGRTAEPSGGGGSSRASQVGLVVNMARRLSLSFTGRIVPAVLAFEASSGGCPARRRRPGPPTSLGRGAAPRLADESAALNREGTSPWKNLISVRLPEEGYSGEEMTEMPVDPFQPVVDLLRSSIGLGSRRRFCILKGTARDPLEKGRKSPMFAPRAGILGLLHITGMSRTRLEHPSKSHRGDRIFIGDTYMKFFLFPVCRSASKERREQSGAGAQSSPMNRTRVGKEPECFAYDTDTFQQIFLKLLVREEAFSIRWAFPSSPIHLFISVPPIGCINGMSLLLLRISSHFAVPALG
eukprot:Gb_22592 [translate_table: standard]